MQIKTFTASSPARLDKKVNAFLARQDIVVRQLYPAMSFGTHMVVVEYEAGTAPHIGSGWSPPGRG